MWDPNANPCIVDIVCRHFMSAEVSSTAGPLPQRPRDAWAGLGADEGTGGGLPGRATGVRRDPVTAGYDQARQLEQASCSCRSSCQRWILVSNESNESYAGEKWSYRSCVVFDLVRALSPCSKIAEAPESPRPTATRETRGAAIARGAPAVDPSGNRVT